MKTHLIHRISPSVHLTLTEYTPGRYDITYLTHEPSPEEPNAWFTNNSEDFDDWNTALRVFNMRRESADPFQRISTYSYVLGKFVVPDNENTPIDWDAIHADVVFGSGKDWN